MTTFGKHPPLFHLPLRSNVVPWLDLSRAVEKWGRGVRSQKKVGKTNDRGLTSNWLELVLL